VLATHRARSLKLDGIADSGPSPVKGLLASSSLGNCRLPDIDAALEKLTVVRGAPQSGFASRPQVVGTSRHSQASHCYRSLEGSQEGQESPETEILIGMITRLFV
jgi:hypothetical protein